MTETPSSANEPLRLLALFIAAHVVVWTLMPTMARAPGVLWDDMLETYAWSQE
jgi:hypothetical protein